MILMGLGNFVHGQKIKGLLYLAVEVAYIVFMAVNGITFLSMLGGLGSVPQKEVWDESESGLSVHKRGSVDPDPVIWSGNHPCERADGICLERCASECI